MSDLQKEIDDFEFNDQSGIQVDVPKTVAIVPKSEMTKMGVEENQITAKDHTELWRLAETLMKGEGVPKHLNTTAKVVAAWNLAASLGLKPQPALKNIAYINGSPSIWGDLPKALAERTGELEIYKEYCIDDKYNEISLENKNLASELFAGVVEIKRKGRELRKYYFTRKQAETAGIWGKNVWRPYPDIMIKARARGAAFKTEFPDALMGVAIGEYEHNTMLGFKDVKSNGTGATDSLAEKLNGITESK